MYIASEREYEGAKEYVRRLERLLTDGRSFLTGDALALFSRPIEARLSDLRSAIREYEMVSDLAEIWGALGWSIHTVTARPFAPLQPTLTWSSPPTRIPTVHGPSGEIMWTYPTPAKSRQLVLFTPSAHCTPYREPAAAFWPSLRNTPQIEVG
jgi:hypothetical protein